MNMDNFDKDIWFLHRKLFHRYMKYSKYFRQATETLPAFEKAVRGEENKKSVLELQVPEVETISLLTSSSEDVSEDEGEPEEQEVSASNVDM